MFSFFRSKKIDPKRQLKKVLGEYELPSFPDILLSALQQIRDPRSTPASVSGILTADPGMSVKILRTVNSAAFSLRRKIESVEDAIALLGMSTVESLVLSMAVRDALPSGKSRGFQSVRFWQTAARRAVTARALARILHPAREMESFTAGLLQDMAVPMLADRYPVEYGNVLQAWHEGEEDLSSLEQAAFGWDHAEVGSWICSEWDFPETLAADIGGHHKGPDEEPRALDAVSLVSVLREEKEDHGIEQLKQRAAERHGLTHETMETIVTESFEKAAEVSRAFASS